MCRNNHLTAPRLSAFLAFGAAILEPVDQPQAEQQVRKKEFSRWRMEHEPSGGALSRSSALSGADQDRMQMPI